MIHSITSSIFLKKVATQPVVSIEELKDCLFAIDYPNEYSGNSLKEDFKNAAHLIFPDTDIFVLIFLIRAQKHGLQLAFVDPEHVRGLSFRVIALTDYSDITNFLLPGYKDVFKDSFNGLEMAEEDTEGGFVLLGVVLKHFGKAESYLASDKHLDTIGEIIDFINGVEVKNEHSEVDYLGLLIKYWIPLLTLGTLLIMYWLFDDLKDAAISLACWIGLYFLYKTFNAIKDVSNGTTKW